MNLQKRIETLEQITAPREQPERRPFSHDLITALITHTTPAGWTPQEWADYQAESNRVFDLQAVERLIEMGVVPHG